MLNLTPAEQDWLAELCRKAASIKHAHLANWQEPDYESLGEWLALHILERDFSPQKYGELYDKLHRTGSNT